MEGTHKGPGLPHGAQGKGLTFYLNIYTIWGSNLTLFPIGNLKETKTNNVYNMRVFQESIVYISVLKYVCQYCYCCYIVIIMLFYCYY